MSGIFWTLCSVSQQSLFLFLQPQVSSFSLCLPGCPRSILPERRMLRWSCLCCYRLQQLCPAVKMVYWMFVQALSCLRGWRGKRPVCFIFFLYLASVQWLNRSQLWFDHHNQLLVFFMKFSALWIISFLVSFHLLVVHILFRLTESHFFYLFLWSCFCFSVLLIHFVAESRHQTHTLFQETWRFGNFALHTV